MRNNNHLHLLLLFFGISITVGIKQLSRRAEYEPSANVEAYAEYMQEDLDSGGFWMDLGMTCGIFAGVFELFLLIYLTYILISICAKCCVKCTYLLTCGKINCNKKAGVDNCCSCSRCCISCVPSKESNMTTDSSGGMQLQTSSILLIIVYSLFIGAFISIHVVFSGSSDMNDGIDATFGAVTDLKDGVFGNIRKETEQLIKGPSDSKGVIVESDCYKNDPQLQTQFFDNVVINIFDTMITVATTMKDTASGAEDSLASMSDSGDLFKAWAWVSIQGIYGIQAIFILVIVILVFLEWKCSIKYFQLGNVIFNLQPVLLILTIFLAMCLAGSKFCLDPNQTVIDMMAGSSDLIEFYLKRDQNGYICDGSDVLFDHYVNLDAQLKNLKEQVGDFPSDFPSVDSASCDKTIDDIESTIFQYGIDLGEMVNHIDCPVINDIFTSLLEDGLCSGIVTGLGTIWVSLFFAFVFQVINLFMCIWLGSYFDELVFPKVKNIFGHKDKSNPSDQSENSMEMVPASPTGNDQIRPTTKVTPL